MYRIVGADQREYGPVSEDQVRQWIAEGRANASTIARFEEQAWKPLSTFPEFSQDLAQAPPVATQLEQTAVLTSASGTPNAAPRNNSCAVAGLVSSCVAIVPCCCCSPLFAVTGLVLSAIGWAQINQDPNRWTGKGVAIAGVAVALVGLVIYVLLLVFKMSFAVNTRSFQLP